MVHYDPDEPPSDTLDPRLSSPVRGHATPPGVLGSWILELFELLFILEVDRGRRPPYLRNELSTG
jgi:hypothetical protein